MNGVEVFRIPKVIPENIDSFQLEVEEFPEKKHAKIYMVFILIDRTPDSTAWFDFKGIGVRENEE
jgi:hypothetical protein